MELLIRIVDKGPNVDHSKAGDVIAICPDGWPWSNAERNNPEWVIVSAPITQIEADALLAPPTPAQGPNGPRARRRQTINVAGLKHGDKLTRAVLMAKAKVKP